MKKTCLVSLFLTLLTSQGARAQEAQIYRWTKERPIKVYIKPGFAVPGFRPQLQMLLMQAFGEWTEATPISVAYVTDPREAQITCEWTADRSRMSTFKEDGQAVLVPNGNELTMASLVLLTVPPPSMKTLTDNYAKHVALHEVGHVLGLGHSKITTDVMYGLIYPDDKVYKLTDNDKNTLVALYNKDLSAKPAAAGTVREGAGTGVEAGLPAAGESGAAGTEPGQSATGAGESKIMLPTGTSPEMESLRLNNEAAAALQKKEFNTALIKLEAAHKLAPQNRMITGNLGGLDANLASIAFMLRNMPLSYQYYSKAAVLLDEANSETLVPVLKSYLTVLNIMGKSDEAKKVELRIKQLTGGSK